MSLKLPFNSTFSFIVEEHLNCAPEDVSFAWSFDTQNAAEETLVELVRNHGTTGSYSAYICVD